MIFYMYHQKGYIISTVGYIYEEACVVKKERLWAYRTLAEVADYSTQRTHMFALVNMGSDGSTVMVQ